jgi:ATP-dependent DNA helicase DinG
MLYATVADPISRSGSTTSNEQRTSADDFHKNFPFQVLRERQSYVLKEIDAALASGFRHIILEAPAGFGKTPVAIVVAVTLGTSYICTSTKDLQSQYVLSQSSKRKEQFHL